MVAEESTLSGSLEDTEPRASRAWLFVVLRAEAPTAPVSRHSLDGLKEVRIGRADSDDAQRAEGTLTLRLQDARTSALHARLERVLDHWVIEDLGSRNGTVVNRASARRVTLRDGDLIEIGHTLLKYRELPGTQEAADLRIEPGRDPIGLETLRPDLAESLTRLRSVSTSRETVMILGESGTGKELAAQAVHLLSGRPGAFVAVNCGALPETIVEAELFGHRRGAFSGAASERQGLVRASDRGTLLLDEIGDLRAASQAALLRTLQERQVRPLGSDQVFDVDLRVVCATHQPLEQHVAEGRFRADLLARLRGFVLHLPPLRERREDMGLIVAAILRRLAGARAGKVRFSGTAARSLLERDWPANVRELQNCLSVALNLAGDGPVKVEHLVPQAGALAGTAASSPGPRELDKETLLAALAANGDSVTAAARALGLHRNRLYRLLQQFGIPRSR